MSEVKDILDAIADARYDTANDIRGMMQKWLPKELQGVVQIADNSTIGLEFTLKHIASMWDAQQKEAERLRKVVETQQRMMEFTTRELDMVADVSYTHAQKNGVVKHIAERLRRWSVLQTTRDDIVPPADDSIPF